MTEKELLQKIKEDAQQITPPDSLSPDVMEHMLLGLRTLHPDGTGFETAGGGDFPHAEHAEDTEKTESPLCKAPKKPAPRRKRTRTWRYVVRLCSAAAVFVLAFAVFGQANQISRNEEESETTAFEVTAPEADSASRSGTEDSLTYASSYEEIYEALSSFSSSGSEGLLRTYDLVPETQTAASSMASSVPDGGSSQDYSSTNIQVEGVDEGDIVKTDGSYLYILCSDGSLVIVRTAQGDEDDAVVSVTSSGDDGSQASAGELYLDGDTLCVITTEYTTSLSSGEDDVYSTVSGYRTVLTSYDISDRSAPRCIGKTTQDGFYSDSRKVGDFIYLFSSWTPSIGATYAESTVTPLLNGVQAKASDYYLPDSLTDSQCLVISSVSLEHPSEITDSKVLVSAASDFYVSESNIYILNENYQNANTITEITKFHYEDGEITGVAAGSVTGYLNDSFSLDEYDGNLRLVTTYYGDSLNAAAEVTDWTEHNALYILGPSLNQLAVLSDLAKGETIRSARFLGETGYFVTFRQTDPLFSADLSDPENPKILGELKLSGFSSYLHFYGSQLLLGLGYEADESTGAVTGLKLSAFDLSDPANVVETDHYTVPGVTWCDSLDNYKSILVDEKNGIIGFYCDNRYLVFSYSEEDGFSQELIYDFYTDQLTGQGGSDRVRGLTIGDSLYVAGASFVIRFDMSNGFEKEQVLTF